MPRYGGAAAHREAAPVRIVEEFRVDRWGSVQQGFADHAEVALRLGA
ncbi:hypothetical protein [Aquisediminimonas profunda]|nr:hypothetical protein [Aquisediminimonas profunda]